VIGWFFRNPETGRVVVAQRPNLPLAVYLVATVARLVVGKNAALEVVATVGLVVWAVLEIVRGDSAFRRVLGAVVLAATAARVAR